MRPEVDIRQPRAVRVFAAKSQQEMRELLQRHRISPTPQRLSIAHILFSAPRHLSAEQVIGELTVANRILKKLSGPSQ